MRPTNSYLIKLVQEDGSAHQVQLTQEQMQQLGIANIMNLKGPASSPPDNNCNDNNSEPLGSRRNPIEIIQNGDSVHSTQNISVDYLKQVADALQLRNAENKPEHVVYRIVRPEELNLQRISTCAKRGRPKRRMQPLTVKANVEEIEVNEIEVPIKSTKTRSGRITRRPPHFAQAFNDATQSDEQQLTAEPTATHAHKPIAKPPPISRQRKRPSPSHYICPKCDKKYLGRVKFMKHLEQNADHAPLPDYRTNATCETWHFLRTLLDGAPLDGRGMQFCREVFNFVQILRRVAPLLFKSAATDKSNICAIDEDFGATLGLHAGNYTLNEADLLQTLDTFAYFDLQRFDETFLRKNGAVSEQDRKAQIKKQTESAVSNDAVKNQTNSPDNVQQLRDYSTSGVRSSETAKMNGSNKQENANLCELLADANLLTALPHMRTTNADLLLSQPVANLLDTSTSSDELNVDQFVNERFKNITEADLELTNAALSLDLPALELFQFHTS